ncbi:hypothetical protein K461DRAFT_283127 [Myriangium duriaei CBS 260.36]|uniref:Magnesium and cobalt transporter CorA n=1 Tax=Myriangium duriaei CBS 260.36 TaxID=1168546 RepID=A0A9P4MFL0_9PEZI|nr:hypothetical protein K461DRAFT_283127 [Myriangium duriaei CBS 260.36]
MDESRFYDFPFHTSYGTHIFYLPSAELIGSAPLNNSYGRLRADLERRMLVPPLFWQRLGWDSNGFFVTKEAEFTGRNAQISTSRFLVKELEESVDDGLSFRTTSKPIWEDVTPRYRWRYMGFHAMWMPATEEILSSLFLFCFDTDEDLSQIAYGDRLIDMLQKHFMSSFKSPHDHILLSDPFVVQIRLIEFVVQLFDSTVWKFREPLRQMEQSRNPAYTRTWLCQELATRRPSKSTQGPQDEVGPEILERKQPQEKIPTRKERLQQYYYTHELSRHLIHVIETLDVAHATASLVLDEYRGYLSRTDPQNRTALNATSQLKLQLLQLQNLRYRAISDEKRLDAQMKLIFHFVDLDDVQISTQILEDTKQLLEESRKDDREITQFLTRLSIAFLPPTFTSGFFGMNFFTFGKGDLWIYFVVTVPLMVMAVLWGQGMAGLRGGMRKRKEIRQTAGGVTA